MSKYQVTTQGTFHTVKVSSIESAPDFDYFHVTEASDGRFLCDGDGPKCNDPATCAHVKAVAKSLIK